jgi:hypothetical protein
VRDRNDHPLGWIAVGDAAALPGLARKLPHYGKYGYLVFGGQAPDNRLKGQWPASDSRLTVWMTDERPPLAVPPRAPLTAVLDSRLFTLHTAVETRIHVIRGPEHCVPRSGEARPTRTACRRKHGVQSGAVLAATVGVPGPTGLGHRSQVTDEQNPVVAHAPRDATSVNGVWYAISVALQFLEDGFGRTGSNRPRGGHHRAIMTSPCGMGEAGRRQPVQTASLRVR